MTVSRVLRGEPTVKPETRAKVVEMMREMGYVPSAAAQSLRSKNHLTQSGAQLFALIFGRGTESSVTFFHDIVRGVERSASEFGLCPIHVTMQENRHDSWLRLQRSDDEGTAWVFAQLVSTEGDLSTLNVAFG